MEWQILVAHTVLSKYLDIVEHEIQTCKMKISLYRFLKSSSTKTIEAPVFDYIDNPVLKAIEVYVKLKSHSICTSCLHHVTVCYCPE